MTTNKHSIIIKFNKNDPSIEESNIQHLPFNLLYNGFARVSNYFKVEERQGLNDKIQLNSSFRGIKLVGERLELPQGFNGFIFRDENQDSTENNDNNSNNNSNIKNKTETSINNKQWEAISKFNNYTYWNRETIPSDFDKPVQALKSLNILSVINKEVTNEEIQNEINSNKVNNKGSSNSTTTSTTNSTPTKIITTTITTTSTPSNSNSPATTPTKSKIVTIQKSNSSLVEDMEFDLDENDQDTVSDNDENEEENKRKQKKFKST